jgi:hypothetical protein
MTKRHDTAGHARLYHGTWGLLGLRPTDDPLIDARLWPLRDREPLSVYIFMEERVRCMIKSFLNFIEHSGIWVP